MNFRSLRFLVSWRDYNVKIVFYMIRGTRNLYKIDKKSMQIRCSKKGCKNQEKCSKMHPKWESKSTQILKKTWFKNVLFFGINFRRPLVPKMLAKWSPTRRTSSRKPNRKGKLQEKGTPGTVFESQHARGAGGEPPARSGSRLPAAIFPLRASGKLGAFEKECAYGNLQGLFGFGCRI